MLKQGGQELVLGVVDADGHPLAQAPVFLAGEPVRAITRLYVVSDDVEGYIARWPDLRTIVTIVPAHIVSWSGEDEIL